MKRAAHETRADHLAAFDRRPELLAAEVFEARPERDVWRGRPLRLQRREPFDRRDDADAGALEKQLSREHRAVQLPKGQDRSFG